MINNGKSVYIEERNEFISKHVKFEVSMGIKVDLSVRQLDIQGLEPRKQIWTGSTQL